LTTFASDLVGWLDRARSQGHRIVLASGCFDILHVGHVGYLRQASGLGDTLVVGLNSDISVRNLKGPTRPVNQAWARATVLASLSCVDRVVVFDEPTPHKLIATVRPHVYAKGGDYTRETLPEWSLVEEVGGRVQILPQLPGYSTSDLIARMQEESATGRVAWTEGPGPVRVERAPETPAVYS
jgi:D-beta-D-heptose 7-phosphate kinase/D-beta-D-heptose 1-phosphate adenosyltransferase